MQTGDHYYNCLVSRLQEENDLRRKAFDELILLITCNASHDVVFNGAYRIDRQLDRAIKASEDKWINIQFELQQADKKDYHRR